MGIINKKDGYVFLIFVILLTTLFVLQNTPKKIKGNKLAEVHYVQIAGQEIKVDLALTPEMQSQGLSGRQDLPEGEGMLFVFQNAGIYPFWMKDMNFPIDIIWLAPSEGGDGQDLKVIYIKKDAQPSSYPDSFGPNQNAKYVLEVPSGFSDKNNLKVGDRALLVN